MSKYFKCTTNKNPLEYSCGEKIIFTVIPRDNRNNTDCRFVKWELLTDDGKKDGGLCSCSGTQPLVVETVMDKPGFARLICTAYTADTYSQDNSFDRLVVSAGADIDRLSYLDTVPDDFDTYWADLKAIVDAHTPELIYSKEVTDGVPEGVKCYDIRISTPEGRPASGYMSIPTDNKKHPIIAFFSGYGIGGAAKHCFKDAISVHINAHGIENDLCRTELVYKYEKELKDYGLSEEENSSNMTTYWRGVMMRDLIGLKFLKSLPQWDGENLTVSGGSQGAYQATVMASVDPDVTFLEVSVPWFCNLRAEEFGFMNGWRAKFAEGLRYFDTVAHGMRVKCPVKMKIGLGDYCCPPSTTVTLYNAFKTEKTLEAVQGAFHEMQFMLEEEHFYKSHSPQNPTGELRTGIYRDYQGNEYEVMGKGYDGETGHSLAIYKSLSEPSKTLISPANIFDSYVYFEGRIIKKYEFVK